MLALAGPEKWVPTAKKRWLGHLGSKVGKCHRSVFRDLEPAVPSDRGLLQAGRRATASGQGTVRTQVASARIAGDLGPTLLHPNGNLLGQAVFTLERLQ
jgi:hypothetical protein